MTQGNDTADAPNLCKLYPSKRWDNRYNNLPNKSFFSLAFVGIVKTNLIGDFKAVHDTEGVIITLLNLTWIGIQNVSLKSEMMVASHAFQSRLLSGKSLSL